jgi:SH3-like domain-containing protein
MQLPSLRRLLPIALLAAALGAPGAAPAASPSGGATGRPLPRFVSLKASRVNVRIGPSNGHAVKWIFVRAGLPVEIVQEFENWRRIRDSAGAEGWVYQSLLSGRRTVLVAPWQGGATVELRADARDDAAVVARLAPNVVALVKSCDGKWCRIEGKDFDGYAGQDKLWGVYPDEVVD